MGYGTTAPTCASYYLRIHCKASNQYAHAPDDYQTASVACDTSFVIFSLVAFWQIQQPPRSPPSPSWDTCSVNWLDVWGFQKKKEISHNKRDRFASKSNARWQEENGDETEGAQVFVSIHPRKAKKKKEMSCFFVTPCFVFFLPLPLWGPLIVLRSCCGAGNHSLKSFSDHLFSSRNTCCERLAEKNLAHADAQNTQF